MPGCPLLLTSPDSSKTVTLTWKKRGSRYLRYALYNATKYVCRWDPTFAAYLAKKRAEGKHYNVALSHAAKKVGSSDICHGEIQAAILLSDLSATTRIASRGLTRPQLCYTLSETSFLFTTIHFVG